PVPSVLVSGLGLLFSPNRVRKSAADKKEDCPWYMIRRRLRFKGCPVRGGGGAGGRDGGVVCLLVGGNNDRLDRLATGNNRLRTEAAVTQTESRWRDLTFSQDRNTNEYSLLVAVTRALS
ncbi:hypothetical protein QOT17_024511, partial [Balamuthia mandrillaris]